MRNILIVAIGENGEIGHEGDLPWPKLSADMKFFKDVTVGHTVIMGRRTFESIPEKFRPLPERVNIVLSRKVDFSDPPHLFGASSVKEALQMETRTEKAFLIGGVSIYQEALEQRMIDVLLVTRVHGSFPADVFFPPIDWDEWKLVSTREVPVGKETPIKLTFEAYN